jgi:PIN domain nuclease of toxin-antitoxin system
VAVSLLLDTHVLLWWLQDDPRLCDRARQTIADRGDVVAASAASVWEIGVKRATGRLKAPAQIGAIIEAQGFEPLAITFAHATEAGALPPFHADPFDRMLVAQARTEGLILMTADPKISRYDVPTMAP